MVAGDWQPHIPAATIGRPRMAARVIPRPGVLVPLLAAGAGDLVVISGPAGYGKTTAAALWDDADARPFAWVRVDHLDDDPAHLLLHIATAVQHLGSADRGLLGYLRGPGRPALTHLVPAVVEALEQSGPLVVVLDDAHELSASEAIETLHALIDAAPASTTIALVGRSTPPLDVARWRVQRRIVEVGTEALRFSGPEAAAVMESVSGPVDDATVSAVVDICEGCAAGVILAGMVLRNGASIEEVTGRHNLMVDYMVEEVLARLDDATATFLVESSVLDRFTAEQLDVILGRDDSARMLTRLSTSGSLFVVCLDQQGVWYRYHRLFGDVLRSRLRTGTPRRMKELASRAADLLECRGDIDGALLQALTVGDRARAAALVGREAVQLGFDGRAGVLARRLSWLDTQTFAEHADAALARAWLGVTQADADVIHRSLTSAHRADRGQSLADGTPSVAVAAALINSVVGLGGVHDVAHSADVVRAAGDSLANPWWGAATVMKGAAESMLGNVSGARALLESALPVTEHLPGFHAAALAHLALIDLGEGDEDAAVERSAAARTLADKYDLCDVVPMVVVYATSAVMSARIGDLTGAREAITTTDKLLDRLGHLAARTALLGHGLLAWTGAVIRDADLMSRHLDAADRAALREPDAVALIQRVERVRAMAAGGARPLTAAELRLLPFLATHFSLQRIADELVVGRETAKSQATSIYRKLGVASRAGAVAEARRIGLLAD